jgi:hypothetical protein
MSYGGMRTEEEESDERENEGSDNMLFTFI